LEEVVKKKVKTLSSVAAVALLPATTLVAAEALTAAPAGAGETGSSGINGVNVTVTTVEPGSHGTFVNAFEVNSFGSCGVTPNGTYFVQLFAPNGSSVGQATPASYTPTCNDEEMSFVSVSKNANVQTGQWVGACWKETGSNKWTLQAEVGFNVPGNNP